MVLVLRTQYKAGEFIGFTSEDFASNNLNTEAQYDPYKKDLTGGAIEYRAFARFILVFKQLFNLVVM